MDVWAVLFDNIGRTDRAATGAAPAQNTSGGPAISVLLGATAAALPIGVQLAAPWGEERRLLELAYGLEASRP